nr:diguanylate cyclase [Aestuariicella albida]
MVLVRRRIVAFLLACLVGVVASVAGGAVPVIQDVILTDELKSVQVVRELRYRVVDQGALPDALRDPSTVGGWEPYTGKVSSAVKNDKSLWFGFRILPAEMDDERWLLSVQLATLNYVKIYTYNTVTGEWWDSRPVGLSYPINQRYKPSRHLAFPLNLVQGQPLHVFMEVRSPNMVAVPMQLIKENRFDIVGDVDLLAIGVVLGTLVVMSLYNLSLFISLRDTSYLYYTAYICFASLYLAAMTGIGPYYLWPGYQWLTDYGLLTFASLSFLMATLFVRKFLELHRYGELILHSNTLLLMIWLVFAVTFSLSHSRPMFHGLGVMSIVTCFVGLGVSLYLALKRSIPALIFSVAWLALIVGTLVFSLMLEGVLPFNYFTAYSQIFGMVIELILLSFALAYRVQQDRHKKELAQEEALSLAVRVSQERSQRLEAQKETLELQMGLTEKLETQVMLRTRQYEEAMEKLEEANSSLLRLSMTDSLSKLSNRRCFDNMVVEESRRACRNQQPLAIVLVDIDFFKAVNDTYGHGVGDGCIRHVAELLGSVVSRAGDLLARYGGEEFVYLLPATSAEQAAIVAEKSRKLVETTPFLTENGELSLTISLGVASWIPESESDYTLMIEQADKALYQAKSRGRNQVVVNTEF